MNAILALQNVTSENDPEDGAELMNSGFCHGSTISLMCGDRDT
ncbi:hypothetical protein OHS33_31780 [Streptomyces sp. NBC_00536]|nr:hypothetical protein [Streptomyces sp. NBC_00536]WUC82536.1 hypothetical protein OHS33_31780 [Streptomyces sp. NBC_00536]